MAHYHPMEWRGGKKSYRAGRGVKRRVGLDVPQVDLRGGKDGHIPVDARNIPEVLPLQIAPIAPPEDLNGQEILPLVHHGGDIKLAGPHRVLGVPDQGAIDPAVISRLDPIKPQEDGPADPRGRDLELDPVAAVWVVIRGDIGGIGGEGIADVGVARGG